MCDGKRYGGAGRAVASGAVAVCPSIGIPTSIKLYQNRRRVLFSQTVFDFVSRIASLKKD